MLHPNPGTVEGRNIAPPSMCKHVPPRPLVQSWKVLREHFSMPSGAIFIPSGPGVPRGEFGTQKPQRIPINIELGGAGELGTESQVVQYFFPPPSRGWGVALQLASQV